MTNWFYHTLITIYSYVRQKRERPFDDASTQVGLNTYQKRKNYEGAILSEHDGYDWADIVTILQKYYTELYCNNKRKFAEVDWNIPTNFRGFALKRASAIQNWVNLMVYHCVENKLILSTLRVFNIPTCHAITNVTEAAWFKSVCSQGMSATAVCLNTRRQSHEEFNIAIIALLRKLLTHLFCQEVTVKQETF